MKLRLSSNHRNNLLHIAAWTSWFILIYLLQPPDHTGEIVARFNPSFRKLNISITLFLILIFYLNAYVLVPKWLYAKKPVSFVLAHLAIIILYTLVAQTLFHYLSNGIVERMQTERIMLPLPLIWIPYFFMLIISTAYRYVKDNLKKERWLMEKQKEGLQSELLFLKSQVSPHFVFNVLNNMVSLARKKSDALEPALIQLSSLLRYMLYDTDADKVPISKEILYLHNYIDLQKLRYKGNLRIHAFLEEPKEQLQIAPMLLIPFIENAFKHGTNLTGSGFIKVELTFTHYQLSLNVVNKYEINGSKDKASGIGLVNVQRRLALLYPDRYKLEIVPDHKQMIFMVNLEINLQP